MGNISTTPFGHPPMAEPVPAPYDPTPKMPKPAPYFPKGEMPMPKPMPAQKYPINRPKGFSI